MFYHIFNASFFLFPLSYNTIYFDFISASEGCSENGMGRAIFCGKHGELRNVRYKISSSGPAR